MLILAIWVIAITVAVNILLVWRMTDDADTLLRARAQAVAATVEITNTGQVRIEDGRDDAALDSGTWVFVDKLAVQQPAAGRSLDADAARLTGRGRVLAQTGGAGGTRWYAEPVPLGDHPIVTVVTSLSMVPYQNTEKAVLSATAVVGLLLLAAAFLVLQFSVRRALSPVVSMTHQAARWSAEDVNHRFGSQIRAPELDDLAHTLDGLLDRLSAVLRREQRLSTEISHELRTPLTRLLTEIELLQTGPRHADAISSTLLSLESTTVEMASIIDTLMTVARTDLRRPPGRCDVVEVVRSAVDRRADRSVVTLVAAGTIMAGIEAGQLERALSPILDNAVRFARARVDLRITNDRSTVMIEVQDDGPGIAIEDLPHVFEPGRRGAVSNDHDGAGLGLALARRLITAAGGTIRAGYSATGAVLTVTLPAA